MYGPPGCGKTMLAKAVAAHTTASFIRVVGSEFVQKYLGEGEIPFFDSFIRVAIIPKITHKYQGDLCSHSVVLYF